MKLSRDMVIIVNHIKRLRLKSGLSIEQVSILSNVPVENIKKIESYYYGISVNDIINLGYILGYKIRLVEAK